MTKTIREKKIGYAVISTRAVKFGKPKYRFDKELRELMNENHFIGIDIKPELNSPGYLITFKLEKYAQK
jgi:hypothetical protein